MLKLKSEIWTNSKGKRFLVLPEDDFARISEVIEDAGLSRILREAKKSDTRGTRRSATYGSASRAGCASCPSSTSRPIPSSRP